MRLKNLACFQHVNWNPTRGDLRKFALSMLVGFGVIGAFVAWRNDTIVPPVVRLWGIGVALSAGAVIPGLGRLVYLAVYLVTGVVGYVMSRVILTVMFFVIVTPIGVILRLTGKDLLRLRRSPDNTDWLRRASRPDRRSYYRQF